MLLLIVGLKYLSLGDEKKAAIIFSIVLLNESLGMYQEQ